MSRYLLSAPWNPLQELDMGIPSASTRKHMTLPSMTLQSTMNHMVLSDSRFIWKKKGHELSFMCILIKGGKPKFEKGHYTMIEQTYQFKQYRVNNELSCYHPKGYNHRCRSIFHPTYRTLYTAPIGYWVVEHPILNSSAHSFFFH